MDDIIVYSETWSEHVETIRKLFHKLSEANLTSNFLKYEFCRATVTYLGHEEGQGRISPRKARIEAICQISFTKGGKGVDEISRYGGILL